MNRPPVPQPLEGAGFAAWGAAEGDIRVLFAGRGPEGLGRQETLRALVGDAAPPVASARQIHGVGVLSAESPGTCGDGDALITDRPALALSIVTADCVPVLIAAGDRIAAVHAGWRGVVAGVVPATVARLLAEGADTPATWSAWIGPAIGGCCYEVSEEVAAQIAEASTPDAILPPTALCTGQGDRPAADLNEAVRHQLRMAGVERIAWRIHCTRCDPQLCSYRRDGKGAGRNHAFIWRQRPAE